MKIIIFGAAGRTGRELVEQGRQKGYEVTAFKGDVRDYETVRKAIPGHDAVLSALGTKAHVGLVITLVVACQFLAPYIPGPGWLIRIVVPVVLVLFFSRRNTVLSVGAQNIVRVMKESGVRRLIWQSALGIGTSKGQLGAVYNFFLIPFFLRGSFADKETQEKIITGSGLDWVIVRPGSLTNGKRTGVYHQNTTSGNALSTPSISRADVADFMLKQVAEDTNLHTTPGIVGNKK